MRLITYDRGGARRLGAWVGETVVDLPEAVGHPAFPPTMEALVEHIGGSILDAAHDILEDDDVVAECAVPAPTVLPPVVPASRPIRVVHDRARVSTLSARGFRVGLACIVGRASRTRRLDRPRSMIFGYTLFSRWPNGRGSSPSIRLGPSVVTPDELEGRPLRLTLTMDAEPYDEKTVLPDELFAPAIATVSSDESLEAGEIFAWTPWTFGSRGQGARFRAVGSLELVAPPIGALRLEQPPK